MSKNLTLMWKIIGGDTLVANYMRPSYAPKLSKKHDGGVNTIK